jgi:hypothetical protein
MNQGKESLRGGLTRREREELLIREGWVNPNTGAFEDEFNAGYNQEDDDNENSNYEKLDMTRGASIENLFDDPENM